MIVILSNFNKCHREPHPYSHQKDHKQQSKTKKELHSSLCLIAFVVVVPLIELIEQNRKRT